MPKECVWPANPCKSCGAQVDQSRLCREHMQQVAGDGRHPGVRLAGLSAPGLGPQGNLFLPLVGRLGADRELTGTFPLSGHSQGALE